MCEMEMIEEDPKMPNPFPKLHKQASQLDLAIDPCFDDLETS